MGFIYAIITTESDQIYIGKTVKSIQRRFKEHITEANKGLSNSKLNRAIREKGEDGVYIIPIEECDNSRLNEREAFYIKLFDSVNSGLNTLYGNTIIFSEKEYVCRIVADFLNGIPLIKLAEKYKLTYSYLSSLMTRLGIHREYVEYTPENSKKPVIVYDMGFNPIRKFGSIAEAIKWLCDQSKQVNNYNGYTRIKQACLLGNVAYGYRWQFIDSLVFDNKAFNTVFDIDAYRNGAKIYKNKFGLFETHNTVVAKFRNKDNSKHNTCKICGKIINSSAIYCNNCYRDNIECKNTYKNRQVPRNLELKYPLEKEKLMELYPKYTLNSIAKACGVSYSSMDRLAKKYGIK